MLLRASLVSGNVYGEDLVSVILIYPVCLAADQGGRGRVRYEDAGKGDGKEGREKEEGGGMRR